MKIPIHQQSLHKVFHLLKVYKGSTALLASVRQQSQTKEKLFDEATRLLNIDTDTRKIAFELCLKKVFNS